MPFKAEKKGLHIPESQDRRIKLTKDDKETIRMKYSTGLYSLNQIAREYGVCKKTILLTVNDNSMQVYKDYRKENSFAVSKEKRNEYMRKHRQHKQKLYEEGKLK